MKSLEDQEAIINDEALSFCQLSLHEPTDDTINTTSTVSLQSNTPVCPNNDKDQ